MNENVFVSGCWSPHPAALLNTIANLASAAKNSDGTMYRLESAGDGGGRRRERRLSSGRAAPGNWP
jgi:hypothetical protein